MSLRQRQPSWRRLQPDQPTAIMLVDKEQKIGRDRQIYRGAGEHNYAPLAQR